MATKAKPGRALSNLASEALDRAEAHKARAVAKIRSRPVPRGDAEAHRQRGLARLRAATAGQPTKVLRLDITNVLSGNDYSAQLAIGSKGAVANVLLDTGSSTLAIEPAAYSGAGDTDLKATTLIQLITYGTGGWAGPVVTTTATFGTGADQIALPKCPIAITSVQEKGNFQGVSGIMGLAYNGLNDAFDFKTYLTGHGKTSAYPWPFGKAWKTFIAGFKTLLQNAGAAHVELKPYFDQVEEGGVVANKFAFYTLRSWVSMRRGAAAAAVKADPLNKGYFILGGVPRRRANRRPRRTDHRAACRGQSPRSWKMRPGPPLPGEHETTAHPPWRGAPHRAHGRSPTICRRRPRLATCSA
jgi:hypothetical protein